MGRGPKPSPAIPAVAAPRVPSSPQPAWERAGTGTGSSSLPSSLWELEIVGFIPVLCNGRAPNPTGAAPPARLTPCLSFPTENEAGVWLGLGGLAAAFGGGEEKEAGVVPPLICSYSWNLIPGYI